MLYFSLRRETGSFKWERSQEGDFNFYFIPFYYVQTFNNVCTLLYDSKNNLEDKLSQTSAWCNISFSVYESN